MSRRHPRDCSSAFSKFFEIWLIEFAKYTKKALRSSKSLFGYPKSLGIEDGFLNLELSWMGESKKEKPQFSRALSQTYGKEYLWGLIPLGISMSCYLAQAILISEFIKGLSSGSSMTYQISICFGITLASVIGTVQNDRSFLIFCELGIKIRANCAELIFKKVLKIPKVSLDSNNCGKVITMVTSDLSSLSTLCMTPYLILFPLYLSAALVILWFKIGLSGVIAQIVMVIDVPLIILLSQLLNRAKDKIDFYTRMRIEFLGSMIKGIKLIKAFNWQRPIFKKLKEIRSNEILYYVKKAFVRILSFSIVTGFQGVIILFTYWLKITLGGSLEVSEVFCGISILITSHFYITAGVSESILTFKTFSYIFTKITELLLTVEVHQIENSMKPHIHVEGVNAGWNSELTQVSCSENLEIIENRANQLRDVNFFIGSNQTCAVVGAVGSGKSTFLNTLLGECYIINGRITIGGTMAYLSQEPWIISGSIIDNIVMGRPFNSDRYKKVLTCCELDEDLLGMPYGDETKVGVEGKLLSGGQKARLCLARTIYSDAQIYLLDDPFSSLDVRIAESIMQKTVRDLLKNSIRIMVINDLDLLNIFDKILVFYHGEVEFSGTFNDFIDNSRPMRMMDFHLKNRIRKDRLKPEFLSSEKQRRRGSLIISTETVGTMKNGIQFKLKIYIFYAYLLSGFKSIFIILIYFLACLGVQMFYIYSQHWLALWSIQSKEEQKNDYYPEVLAIVTLLTIVGTIFRNIILFVVALIASKNFHNKAAHSIINASIDIFYNKTPKEFLDSFSGDIFQIDEQMTNSIANTVMFGLMILGYIVYIIYILPINLSILGIFMVLSVLFIWYCIRSILYLRQRFLDSSAPITKIFQEVMTGISTIRSLNIESYFTNILIQKNNKVVANYLNFFYFVRFFMVLISVGASISLSLNLFFILIFLDGSQVNLCSVSITFTLSIMNYLPWFFRGVIDILSIISCLERVNSFIKIPPEVQENTATLAITQGKIEFIGVSLAYSGYCELALNQINFKVNGGQRLGIIGRSGSGKSSIFNALFRLSKLTDGEILIDGHNINEFSLASLRSQISIIPQSPMLFSGSVRFNLDPFYRICEEEIWRVLSIVELSEIMLNYGLNSDVNSIDLSMGQKQLLNLARVLMQNNKIIVFDEATSYVDAMTERHMHFIIDEYFSEKTIMSIAHKLRFVKNYDLVLLLDNGAVIDILPPIQMMTSEHTRFHKSVKV